MDLTYQVKRLREQLEALQQRTWLLEQDFNRVFVLDSSENYRFRFRAGYARALRAQERAAPPRAG